MQVKVSTRTIHPFPARMAPEIALDAIPERTDRKLTVLDPMCGSGTVLSVALSRGHRALGVDIDPLAVMMSRVATDRINVDELLSVGNRIADISRRTKGRSPWANDRETEAFARYWFANKQYQELTSLTSAIKRHATGQVRLALEVAISRIIVTKTPQASLAADASHSRPHKVLQSSDYDAIAGFVRSLHQIAKILANRTRAGEVRVLLGDARQLNLVRTSSVDVTVTSPPYLNALDYLRGHKLALIWFGYTIPELRARRAASIGSERNLHGDASAQVREMVKEIESRVAQKTTLKRGMIERYAQDCVLFANQLSRVVRTSGRVILVVGNSTLRGNYIRNDLVAQTAMEGAGFSLRDRYERELPQSMRYMPINDSQSSSLTKRMRSEIVLVMEN